MFFYLLLVALFMVLLNVVQAFLISHMRQTWWIVIFPLTMLATLLLCIVITAVWRRDELVPVWQDAEGAVVPRGPIYTSLMFAQSRNDSPG